MVNDIEINLNSTNYLYELMKFIEYVVFKKFDNYLESNQSDDEDLIYNEEDKFNKFLLNVKNRKRNEKNDNNYFQISFSRSEDPKKIVGTFSEERNISTDDLV